MLMMAAMVFSVEALIVVKTPSSTRRTIEVREIACLLGNGVTVVRIKTSDAGTTSERMTKWVLGRCYPMKTLI
jgi:hypothetical protein